MSRLAHRLMALVALLAVMLVPALPVAAQDDKTLLENWLQDNLSTPGQEVRVTGFAGALSSRATLGELTIADDQGVWLTLRDAELDWTRSAILGGRLEINSLTAKSLDIARRPVAPATTARVAASEFRLPDLPVAIRIGRLAIASVTLGEAILGEPVALEVAGAAQLEGGEGRAALSLTRRDGRDGRLALTASFANATGLLALDLSLDEARDGILARLTGLPGGAPVALRLSGAGPVDAFSADVALATDGTERLAGGLTLARVPVATGQTGPAGTEFRAQLSGDARPLVAPDLRPFFGDATRASVTGRREADGTWDLTALEIESAAMRLSASARLVAGGWPERLRVAGTIADAGDRPVRLPLPGAPMRVNRAEIDLSFDAAQAETWTARATIDGLERPDLVVARLALLGSGTIEPGGDAETAALTGRLSVDASGIAPRDPALARAIGGSLTGETAFARSAGTTLALSELVLRGDGFNLAGALDVQPDWRRLDVLVRGALTLQAADLARFSALAGRDLAGAATLRIAGNAALPGGAFDLELSGQGQDLGLGWGIFDRIFAGPSRLDLSAARDISGTRIRQLNVAAAGAALTASGVLQTDGSQLTARLDMADAALLAAALAGPVAAAARLAQSGDTWQVDLTAQAPGGAQVAARGTVNTGTSGIDRIAGELDAQIAELAPYSGLAGRSLAGAAEIAASATYLPATGAFTVEGDARSDALSLGIDGLDKLIDGAGTASFAMRRDAEGRVFVDRLTVNTADIAVSALGRIEAGVPTFEGKARLGDLGLIVPGLAGAFDATAQGTLSGDRWQVEAAGKGPGGTGLTTRGFLGADLSRAGLAIAGQVPLALANPFVAPRQLSGMASLDLTLDGPIVLSSLTGTIRASAVRVTLPTYRFALDPVDATARIAGGQATVAAEGNASTGGRVTVDGTVALIAPYASALEIRAASLRLIEPALYDVTLSGGLKLAGPVTGGGALSGAVRLNAAEFRIPESGFVAGAVLDGLRHLGEPAAVRQTRERAGLAETDANGAGSGSPFALDLEVSAPEAVFVRGRGLDAELGGRLRLSGTTAEVITQGGFTLIRGRLDLLGNRLVLTEGQIDLRGSLDPALRFAAETTAADVDVTITLEGAITDPRVSFASSPALPEDEILARLVFGHGLAQLSPFQALKLASAVATLSGRGGSGTIDRLRSGFGLDDLDVTTGEGNALSVTAGAYLNDRLYTDVTVDAAGRSEVTINLSITPQITARGGLASDGASSLGVFFEKDY